MSHSNATRSLFDPTIVRGAVVSALARIDAGQIHSRLEVAVRELRRFIAGRPADRIGLIVFSRVRLARRRSGSMSCAAHRSTRSAVRSSRGTSPRCGMTWLRKIES